MGGAGSEEVEHLEAGFCEQGAEGGTAPELDMAVVPEGRCRPLARAWFFSKLLAASATPMSQLESFAGRVGINVFRTVQVERGGGRLRALTGAIAHSPAPVRR